MSKIRESARGGQCQIRLPGICNHNPETVVLAHYRMAGSCGMGMKPNDAQAAYACSRCHDAVDGRLKTDLTRDELQTAFAVSTHSRPKAAGSRPTAARRRVYRKRAVAALLQTLRPAAHLLLRRPAILANRRLRPRLRLAAVSAAGRHDGHGKRQSDAVYQRPPRYPQAVWQLPHRAARTGLFSRARQNAKNQRRAGHLQLVVLQQAKQKGHGRPFLSNLREQYRGHQI